VLKGKRTNERGGKHQNTEERKRIGRPTSDLLGERGPFTIKAEGGAKEEKEMSCKKMNLS